MNKICSLISKKLADFIVENRTCSVLDDKIRRAYQSTKSADFCMTDDKFLLADFLADKIGQVCRSSDIPFTVVSTLCLIGNVVVCN